MLSSGQLQRGAYGLSCNKNKSLIIIHLQFPEPARKQEEENPRPPGSLPEGVELDTPSRDLLLRLLQIDPSRRLRSLRTLTTIAFYKGYNIQDVQEKKVSPNELLKLHFPHGPPNRVAQSDSKFDGFDWSDDEY
ncbi:hypothetical protein WA026_000422 [Henosepilachna vigintioctopunctata]|uniref:Uncharacterized protein n=1 Tax=Henosepilachna vigintioctopunctata TaxID=420089 RepID=A0AAW1V5Q4_9CUCU